LKNVLSLAQTPAEQDMLLLSSLVACGSVMPNLYCRYGLAAKRYYPNLQLFIVGSAACGKGIANLALELVKPVHEATPLIIPGDATYPAFYQTLAKQHGRRGFSLRSTTYGGAYREDSDDTLRVENGLEPNVSSTRQREYNMLG
jgi:hypothetical protein